ncbi:DASH family cryptochrome [Zunongwangia endophytica]|uniref:Cryptochrome DASH n=1 Tax=Zunongwangia endophytica TaxID=1808945 RepID=A0ABV8H798_9FLAO|nr:DASH family cryptochrome [Zunongwangia endophytica]MDN3596532.1 DASH family cryptochrome [Zunongwangia endophytica]
MSTGLIWFENNLRIKDNEALAEACKSHDRTIAIYCFDPRKFEITKYGFPKTGKFRAKFLLESITQLQQNLEKLNISLLIFQKKPEDIIPEIVENHKVEVIYFQKEWTSEEKEVIEAVRNKLPNTEFRSFYSQFLFHPEDIPYEDFSKIPKVYTEFRKKCEKQVDVRDEIEIPQQKSENNLLENTSEIPNLSDLGLEEFQQDSRTAFPFEGGEDEAWKRIQEYFWNTKNLSAYKQTRNGLLGKDYSSKLSAWLANGSISAVSIYHEVKKFEKEVTKNQDTYWLIFELIWRDFFKYISLKHGNSIFKLGGILDKKLEWNFDNIALEKWMEGKTKEAFVDANMKEIAATGFMSNRGRQNVNSYWAKQLKQDWRAGAAYFESMLIDYDVHSNWGNWMYNSGVGNDPRDRKFNIKSQADRYDPNKEHQDTWLQH